MGSAAAVEWQEKETPRNLKQGEIKIILAPTLCSAGNNLHWKMVAHERILYLYLSISKSPPLSIICRVKEIVSFTIDLSE